MSNKFIKVFVGLLVLFVWSILAVSLSADTFVAASESNITANAAVQTSEEGDVPKRPPHSVQPEVEVSQGLEGTGDSDSYPKEPTPPVQREAVLD